MRYVLHFQKPIFGGFRWATKLHEWDNIRQADKIGELDYYAKDWESMGWTIMVKDTKTGREISSDEFWEIISKLSIN